jgi:hypothetical protein
MVSPRESISDQTRQPGMKRTCVRRPDRWEMNSTRALYPWGVARKRGARATP